MTSELRHNTDKRVIRTKKAIKNALFKLMESKDISDITISELTASANVNRRTFYTHYRTITDILEEIENDLVAALTEMLKDVDVNNCSESIEKLFLRFHSIISEEFDFYFHLMKLDT
ncbi:MAG: TetR/AcrR family transcriptional regulator, partial [Ruminococcaceae bacterium]|nr:TetR/AcrR family transcriptional regulator [Oscillospiraceae bacterium]